MKLENLQDTRSINKKMYFYTSNKQLVIKVQKSMLFTMLFTNIKYLGFNLTGDV